MFSTTGKVVKVSPLPATKIDNSFSKGEKQLLAFARAIAKETSIYVFDEPTSNVDVESEIQLKKVIDNLSKDSTVIIIAHRPATIENVDKILKVEDENFSTCSVSSGGIEINSKFESKIKLQIITKE